MKRFLSLLLAFFMASSVSLAENNYSEDFDAIYNAITEYVEKAEYLCNANVMIWQKEGPNEFLWTVRDIIDSDTFAELNYDGTLRVVFGNDAGVYYNYRDNYFAVAKELSSISDKEHILYVAMNRAIDRKSESKHNEEGKNDEETLKEKLKAFKKAYENEHEDAFEALKDYYNTAMVFGELAIAPSGNLVTYANTYTTMQNELKEMKLDVEFEK